MRRRKQTDPPTQAGFPAVRTWLRLWKRLAAPQRRRLALAVLAMVAGAGLQAAVPVLVGILIDQTLQAGHPSLSSIAPHLGLIAALVVGQELLEVAQRQLVESVCTSFERDNRVNAYRHLMHIDLDRLRVERIGSVQGRTDRSIEGTTKLLRLGAMDLLPTIIIAIAALAVAFTRSVPVASIMLFVVPTGLLLARWQMRSQAGIRVEVRNHKDHIDGEVVELLGVLESVRAAGAEDHFSGRTAEGCGKLRDTELRHHRAMSLFDCAKHVNEGVWLILVIAGSLTLLGRSISPGQIFALYILFGNVVTPLQQFHRILDEASESSLQAQDLLTLLDSPIDRGYNETLSFPRSPGKAPSSLAIDVRNLRFEHSGIEQRGPALDGVNLEVAIGESIGIAGLSGCGKSTLLKLLRRLHHGYEGHIEMLGEDLQSMDHKRLSKLVAYVAQTPHVVHGTVAENIRFGLPGVSDAEIQIAARRASIHQEILAMPAGYATMLGERGDTLSGGQRQRICIARALLRTPQILLLDEPTSALDPAGQRSVQQAIDALQDITVIVVAHRLSTLRSTDRIVVLNHGRVAEEGSYTDLAEKPASLFYAMIEQENRKSPDATESPTDPATTRSGPTTPDLANRSSLSSAPRRQERDTELVPAGR